VWAGIVMLWMLLPLAAVGLYRTRGTDRRILMLPIIVVVVTTVLFYGGHRLRAPAEPVLCLAAAIAVAGWLRDGRTELAGEEAPGDLRTTRSSGR
jgi:hypothetical protein